MAAPLPISIIVHTRNSASTLKKCLSSLPEVRELLVVDMESTDETLIIARQFHARTMTVADVGYVEPARMIAIEQATEPWILIVDADEQLPADCATWLTPLLEENEHAIVALPRRNRMFGHPMTATGWWPDYQVRLFKKGLVEWDSNIHSQPQCQHQPFKLPTTDTYALIHENYQQIAQFIARMNRYTSIEVTSKKSSPVQRHDWLNLMSEEFFTRFGKKQGWKDREQGLALSLLQSFYPLVVALKRWEQTGFAHSRNFEQSISPQLAQLAHNLAYWRASYEIDHSSGLAKLYWQIRRKLQL